MSNFIINLFFTLLVYCFNSGYFSGCTYETFTHFKTAPKGHNLLVNTLFVFVNLYSLVRLGFAVERS